MAIPAGLPVAAGIGYRVLQLKHSSMVSGAERTGSPVLEPARHSNHRKLDTRKILFINNMLQTNFDGSCRAPATAA